MGRFLEILAPHAAHVVGADMSRAVESAQENLARFSNVTVVQADLFRLPFESATFDYVYTFGVVHHTPSPRDAVCALARLVRPGGKLTVWVYGRRGPMWIPRPYQAYTKLLALLPDDTKLRLLERYVKIAIPAGRAAFIGRVLRHLLPVQDLRLKGATQDGYDPRPERVTDDLVHEWAWLNAFDMFTPTFVSQHVWKDVESWFRVAGLVDLERSEVRVAVTGTKPA
jgi:SAM-dependent methyltransferase